MDDIPNFEKTLSENEVGDYGKYYEKSNYRT